ncbi:MAG: ABC transporter ATP-binding protein [Terriglobales bacterium]
MLELRNIEASYGKLRTLHGLDIKVPKGKLTTILGANGAGKTTTLRVIAGLLPASGSILFEGQPLLGLRADKIVRRGISMVPETRELFLEMTVQENIAMGAYMRSDRGGIKRDLDQTLELFPRLQERFAQIAATLSGGEQQMLTIARALMASPKLLLLDEPSLGLAPQLVDQVFDIVDRIRSTGITILLVEQNAQIALALADIGYVMETGEVLLSGSSAELEANAWVQEAYLGT